MSWAQRIFARPGDTGWPSEAAYIADGLIAAASARRRPYALLAAGARIEPTMSADRLRALAGTRQQWQGVAWGYRDAIGELRYALQFRARALSRARLFIAQVDPGDDEPIPVSLRDETGEDGKPTERSESITLPPALCDAAERVLDRLPLDAGYDFLGVLTENWDTAGEAWLYGYVDPETGDPRWDVRSVDDVTVQGGQINIRDDLDQPTPFNPAESELYRMWVPHPRKRILADSALRALASTLEDVVLIGRELRAASRSRIAANGILLIPRGMLEQRNTKDQDDDTPPVDAFMANLQTLMVAPIINEGDAGAVTPAILVGDKADLEAVRHLTFDREDSPALLDKLRAALSRMATSLDIPPEILTGMGDVNHWSAWQIDSATFRHHLEPTLRMIVDSLTQAYLRTVLLSGKYGTFRPEDVRRVRVWYDAGQITENPNRRQDALDARREGAISDDAFRRALGFNDGDAPTAEELVAMIAFRAGVDTASAAKVLAHIAEQNGADVADPLRTATAERADPAPPPAQIPPATGPGQPPAGPPTVTAAAWRLTGTTTTGGQVWTAPLTAAALRPMWRADTATGRELVELDRALRVQLQALIEAHTAAVLKRAGSRLRSKLSGARGADTTAALNHRPVETWAAVLGREGAFKWGADTDFLLARAWDELGEKFTAAVNRTIDAITARVLRMLGGSKPSPTVRAAAQRMSDTMRDRTPDAWTVLARSLDDVVARRMYGEDIDTPARGEANPGAVPTWPVRDALSHIGGPREGSPGTDGRGRPLDDAPVNGLGNGAYVAQAVDAVGGRELGHQWVYGVIPRNTFDPHWQLDGTRFADWADPALATARYGGRYSWLGTHFRPGDHGGCECDYTTGYAIPDLDAATPDEPWTPDEADFAQQVRDRLSQPTQYMQDVLMLAAGDDAAGRTGTTAQATRDQWLKVQQMHARYLKGEL